MDLTRVHYLIHVAQTKSLSRAAAVLGITQPSLSRHIQSLEKECGTRLLYRHGRGVSLTPEGETFLEKMRPLLLAVTDVMAAQKKLADQPAGKITLGLTPTVASLIGMPLLRRIRARHPKIELNVVSGYSGYVHEWLVDARVDLAILHDARRSQYFAAQHLADMGLYLISSGQTPVSKASQNQAKDSEILIKLNELRQLPLILPSGNHGLRRTLETAASQIGITLEIVQEMDYLPLLLELVAQGQVHGVLARPAFAGKDIEKQLLVRRLISPEVSTRLILIKAAHRPMTSAVRVLEQEIYTLFQEMDEQGILAQMRVTLSTEVAQTKAPSTRNQAKNTLTPSEADVGAKTQTGAPKAHSPDSVQAHCVADSETNRDDAQCD